MRKAITASGFRKARPGSGWRILVPLDEDLMIRLNGIRRFHRLLTGRPVRPIPSMQALSAARNATAR